MIQVCFNNDLIDVTGVCDVQQAFEPQDLAFNNFWTEIAVPETLTIPEQKPDIEQLLSLNISVEIMRQKVIVTPDSTGNVPDSGKADANEEGKKITNRKLIIEGKLCQAVSYVADLPEQPVHSAHFTVPFSAFIVLPKDTPLDQNYLVKSCVEDVFITNFDARHIFKNVTVFLQAVPSIPGCPDEQCGCNDYDQVQTIGVCPPEEIATILTPAITTWTQLFIPEILCIPKQKPDIEQLLSATAQVEIISQRVVKTPKRVDSDNIPLPSKEGTYATGRKLVIEGILKQKVIYVADVKKQSVHAAHFDVPFSAFIVLPVDTPLATKYKIEQCIEDIFVCDVCKRQIFKNVTLFLKATELVCL